MALVRSDVCGCLGAWKCSANPLVGLLGRINWLAVIKVIGFNSGFSFTCYEEGWFNHSCAKRLLGGNQPRCEALQLPFFCVLLSGKNTFVAHLPGGVRLFFCGNDRIFNWWLGWFRESWEHQFLLRMPLATSDFLYVLINLATRLTIRISGGAGFL